MASVTTTLALSTYQPLPLARTTSPFKDPRTPPHTPRNTTAKLWDEYEKGALENEKRRTCASSSLQPLQSQRFSSGTVLDIIRSYDPQSSPRIPGPSPSGSATASPRFDFGFSASAHTPRPTSVATFKSCKQSIMSTSGICEKCKTTIVMPCASKESTPPFSPACRNFASTDLPKLHKESASGTTTSSSSSPKRKSRCSSSTQLIDPPIRLSSLKPLRTHDTTAAAEAPRPRKASLTDPNEPFMRLQISRKPVPVSRSHPVSPTTPPSSLHSHAHPSSSSNPRTRPSSLANVTTPPQWIGYSRHASATPSELSTLAPYMSGTTVTSPPRVSRASYNLQNTTSAWDEWDSDEEEKAGLVGYWRGRKWRGSRGSLGGTSGSARRDSEGKEESVKDEAKRKRRGFVRVISCGCGEDE